MKKITKIIIGIVVILLVIGVFFFYKFKSPEPYSPPTNLLNTIPVPASGICSDGVCRQIYGDGEYITPQKKEVKYEKQYFTTNPFGIFYAAKNEVLGKALGVDFRILYDARYVGKDNVFLKFDEGILSNEGDTVFSLTPGKTKEDNYARICVLSDSELSDWYVWVGKVVE